MKNKQQKGQQQTAPAAIFPLGFRYHVEILGNPSSNRMGIESGFQEVSGINVNMAFDKIVSGGENRFAYKVPGRISYENNLELKRGVIVASSPFGDWCRSHFSNGINPLGAGQKIRVENIIVNLLDEEQMPVMSWSFVRAYPVKWEVSSFVAGESKIVVESISLAYLYFSVIE